MICGCKGAEKVCQVPLEKKHKKICTSGKKSVPRDESIGFYVQISDNKSDNVVYAWKWKNRF